MLVLEAGRSDFRFDPFIHMPAALPFPIGNRLYDWKYESEPEPHMNGRRVFHARGKVLGGSSSINGMIFQRGNPLDYERWAADPGMETWDYAHCLPYFKRMETCLPAPTTGAVARPARAGARSGDEPAVRGVLRGRPAGRLPLTDDVNGYRQEGFAVRPQRPPRRRLCAARAYLHPVMDRQNLTVETLAHGHRAVVRRQPGHRRRLPTRPAGAPPARAGEVVLCGGAINSPQLLQLSGIGNAATRRLGIAVVADLPGVGENLQDHLEVYVQYASKQPVSIAPGLKMAPAARIGAEWLFLRRGSAPPTTSRAAASSAATTRSTTRT